MLRETRGQVGGWHEVKLVINTSRTRQSLSLISSNNITMSNSSDYLDVYWTRDMSKRHHRLPVEIGNSTSIYSLYISYLERSLHDPLDNMLWVHKPP